MSIVPNGGDPSSTPQPVQSPVSVLAGILSPTLMQLVALIFLGIIALIDPTLRVAIVQLLEPYIIAVSLGGTAAIVTHSVVNGSIQKTVVHAEIEVAKTSNGNGNGNGGNHATDAAGAAS